MSNTQNTKLKILNYCCWKSSFGLH